MGSPKPIIIATRGSALALAQANRVQEQCRSAFPDLVFEIKIFKTTGDKLLTASLAKGDPSLPKGLFTKELEVALLEERADLAVHSLKDLPTELPTGLELGAVSVRADVHDVLIVRADAAFSLTHHAEISLKDLPREAVVATSSPRRQMQVKAVRGDIEMVEIRGNVLSRLKKLAENPALSAIILAAAGLERLGYRVGSNGELEGKDVPIGLRAAFLPLDVMLPCVGQAALGIEVRSGDSKISKICERLNDPATRQCLGEELAFLRAMGGGCSAPIGAHADVTGGELRLKVVVFQNGRCWKGELSGKSERAEKLGKSLAAQVD